MMTNWAVERERGDQQEDTDLMMVPVTKKMQEEQKVNTGRQRTLVGYSPWGFTESDMTE